MNGSHHQSLPQDATAVAGTTAEHRRSGCCSRSGALDRKHSYAAILPSVGASHIRQPTSVIRQPTEDTARILSDPAPDATCDRVIWFRRLRARTVAGYPWRYGLVRVRCGARCGCRRRRRGARAGGVGDGDSDCLVCLPAAEGDLLSTGPSPCRGRWRDAGPVPVGAWLWWWPSRPQAM